MSWPKVRQRWRIPIIIAVVVLVVLQYLAFSIHESSNSGSQLNHDLGDAYEQDARVSSKPGAEVEEKETEEKPHTVLQGVEGFNPRLPKIQRPQVDESPEAQVVREYRQQAVKNAFNHTWTGYRKYAFKHDEVKPNSNGTVDGFGGWGATLVDSLSTMLVMGFQEEFNEAVQAIEGINYNRTVNSVPISVFETIIRHLGGLLSAYELSGHEILLTKAEELGQVLIPAFDTPYDLPHHWWYLESRMSRDNFTLIAEVGTVQLEFMTLSHYTGDPQYARKAQRITDYVESMGIKQNMHIPGLYPTTMDVGRGDFTNSISSFGGAGDSAFEYFLKQYLLVDGTVPQYKRMYIESMEGMRRYLLRQLPQSDLLYLTPYNTVSRSPEFVMDHLSCFVPGMLAIGSKLFDREEDMLIAKGLLETCVFMYQSSATGLCPERWTYYELKTEVFNGKTYNKSLKEIRRDRFLLFHPDADEAQIAANEAQEAARDTIYHSPPPGKNTTEDIATAVGKRPAMSNNRRGGDLMYLLRPETVESLYVLYRITGDPKYQEYGWEIFEAIEKYCKTPTAYSSIRNVDFVPTEDVGVDTNQNDSMESFFMAETLKYLYLLFSEDDVISLDKFVFNTEAHPLMRRPWTSDSAASINYVAPVQQTVFTASASNDSVTDV
ncbi:glycoside hydrolase [Umbelopsis sp. AD052]|nr:glycoside hydrolase [Umbelopsis sp. AD052]